MKIYIWLYKQEKSSLFYIIINVIFSIIISLLSITTPILLKKSIDSTILNNKNEYLENIIILILIVIILLVTRYLYYKLTYYFLIDTENIVRTNFFNSFIISYDNINSQIHTGEILNRFSSDIIIVLEGIIQTIPNIIGSSILLIGVVLVFSSISKFMALVFTIFYILINLIYFPFNHKLQTLHKLSQEAEGNIRGYAQDCLENKATINIFNAESNIQYKLSLLLRQLKQKTINKINTTNNINIIVASLMQLGQLSGFIWCSHAIFEGKMTYGSLAAIMSLLTQIQVPITNLGSLLPKLSIITASFKRIEEIESNNMKDKSHIVNIEAEMIDSITCKNLSFRYDKKAIITRLSIQIPSHSIIGVTGKSGIGKSTFLKLLAGYIRPDSGNILLKLYNNKEYDLSNQTIDGLFSYVPQNNELMSGSIFDIVSFFDTKNSSNISEVKKACKIACAESFIKQLPNSYDTWVGEKGKNLSSGQQQRLAIARSLYSNASIFLFDEATSALDEKTELQLLHNIKSFYPDKTILIVSHRNEVLKLCNQIINLEQTKI